MSKKLQKSIAKISAKRKGGKEFVAGADYTHSLYELGLRNLLGKDIAKQLASLIVASALNTQKKEKKLQKKRS